MDLKAQLKAAVEAAAQSMGIPVDAAIQDTPASKPGDYGTPAAFQMAKSAGGNPAQIAAQLAQTVQLPTGIKRVEAAGPFLNFFLDTAMFVRDVVENPFVMPSLGGKVVIEHTSVNPNKELHVGHLRNVVLGDSMARIFRAAGHTVEVQNYIDDTGRQAAEALFAINHYHREWDGTQKYDHWLGEGYVRLNADPAKPDLEEGISAIMHRLEAGVLRGEVEKVVTAHLQTCFRLGARYDLLNWESDVVGSGFLTQAMNILESSRYTSRPTEGKYAGAFVMDVSEFMPGLEESNVVLVRSDGTAMYAAKDIGYQFWKFGLFEGMKFKPFMTDPDGNTVWTSAPDGEPDVQRRFGHADEVINVIDSRQDHPQTVVRSSLGVAGQYEKKDRSIHLSYAFVTLEGQTISGRKGIAVSADDAMDEAEKRALAALTELNPDLAAREDAAEIARRIGIGAIRFAMLKAEPTRKIDFRWEQALALNGDTAPYVQYAAVRAASILRKAQEAGHNINGSGADWDALPDVDLALAKMVARLPEVVAQSVRVHSPHVVAQYALDLATAFNAWFNAKDRQGKPATNVLQSEPGLREARLALVGRLRRAFEETLDLIGIEVPAAM
ncbi:arginine--tRNA ligase [Deinococcus deserti]|uniref:Arginine--tRNA ligase n=1 Tax=Deinococcus deserti (strain DSM 17065 / CIP 109153 / LMG 22923 / VCD115) TaxID=546414 RepID=C1CUX2_DEIDV|nr:arginine--tRNA ligase [Deinococcus deserti]ACO45989.2 putative Arginine--tRNA ligase (Arginine translase) (Arginyl-tRNA synthetase) [Deinococcus deserti VCD115]